MATNETQYLGKGVYARFDGFGVLLLTHDIQDELEPRIYLEPAVVRALNVAWQRWTEPEESTDDAE